MRRTLYMAAGIAMRFNPQLAAFALRLKARGKPYKVVVTAVMRKLVVLGSPYWHCNVSQSRFTSRPRKRQHVIVGGCRAVSTSIE